MSSAATQAIYRTKRWRITRHAVLVRDGYRCQVRGPRCVTIATTADHIVELDAGGAPYDLANLRAACTPCNSGRGAAYGNRKRTPRSEEPYVL